MNPVETAILRTVLYADVFDFAMSAEEICHFLIHDRPVSLSQIRFALDHSPELQRLLARDSRYFARAGREDLIDLRVRRERISARLMPLAARYGIWLARLPFVRMVALTGALSMRNAASEREDLDYLLVTAPRRVWLARAFSILLVRLAKLQGVVICPNYVLSETALEQERRDLFIAHEVAQMLPLYGNALYERIRRANDWADEHLPNAIAPFYPFDARPAGRVWLALKRVVEALLGGRGGDALENWERRRKLRRFAHDMQTPHHAAQLDSDHVKGHFDDHGYRILDRYYERLREYGLETEPLAAFGD